MCDPTLALVGLTVASAGMQYSSAKAQAQQQNQVYAANETQSYRAMDDQYQGIGLKQIQNVEAATDEIWNRKLQAQKEQSTVAVAAGESGVSGFSVERVLRDIGAVASRDISTIERNRDWDNQQLQSEATGVKYQAADRIMSVEKGTKPNPWAYAFKAGVDGLSTYAAAGGTFGKNTTATASKSTSTATASKAKK